MFLSCSVEGLLFWVRVCPAALVLVLKSWPPCARARLCRPASGRRGQWQGGYTLCFFCLFPSLSLKPQGPRPPASHRSTLGLWCSVRSWGVIQQGCLKACHGRGPEAGCGGRGGRPGTALAVVRMEDAQPWPCPECRPGAAPDQGPSDPCSGRACASSPQAPRPAASLLALCPSRPGREKHTHPLAAAERPWTQVARAGLAPTHGPCCREARSENGALSRGFLTWDDLQRRWRTPLSDHLIAPVCLSCVLHVSSGRVKCGPGHVWAEL